MRAGRIAGTSLLAALAIVVSPHYASAFCRTSTCTDCPRDPDTGCTIGGTPVFWASRCLSFSMLEGSSVVDDDTARALMQRAFDAWQNVRCGPDGQPPSLNVSDMFGPSICTRPEYNARSGNANVVSYRDDSWPYASATTGLASTLVKFNTQTGELYDADLEVNANLPLSLGDANKGVIVGQFDLLSILTHEAGHFLGLDHSSVAEAVMRPSLGSGEVVTELSEDDIAAICEAYPPARKAAPCDPEPRNGFSAQCAIDPAHGGACDLSVPGGQSHAGATLLTFLASLALLRRRRVVGARNS